MFGGNGPNSHSKYVDNHPECASDLAAYMKDHPDSPAARRLARRAAHHDLAEKFSKRGQQSYYIIAVDHILVSARPPAHDETLRIAFVSRLANEIAESACAIVCRIPKL